MNLVFDKKDPQNIDVKINSNGSVIGFDYVTMIKGLLESGSLGESELNGEFSELEVSSINSMITHLNACVPKDKGQDEDGGMLDGDASDDDLADLL